MTKELITLQFVYAIILMQIGVQSTSIFQKEPLFKNLFMFL
jgi:hypothetical protein